jgi:C4-dicarboxylate-specific signal transduction histidine kinase
MQHVRCKSLITFSPKRLWFSKAVADTYSESLEEAGMPLREVSLPQLPPLYDFVLSPGFAAALVALGAMAVLAVVLVASRRRFNDQLRQQDRHHQEMRTDGRRRETIAFCWERLVWLVKTAGAEPLGADAEKTALGLGPDLTLAILEGLRSQAEDLDDQTLTQAVAVYLTQYGLVLAERLGQLPDSGSAEIGGSDDSKPANGRSEPVDKDERLPASAGASQGRD